MTRLAMAGGLGYESFMGCGAHQFTAERGGSAWIKLRNLLGLYRKALEWAIHRQSGWRLGSTPKVFSLDQRALALLGVRTIRDLDEFLPCWDSTAEYVRCRDEASCRVGTIAGGRLTPISGRGEPFSSFAETDLVERVVFRDHPAALPLSAIAWTIDALFRPLEHEYRAVWTDEVGPPLFHHIRNGDQWSEYLDLRQDPRGVLLELRDFAAKAELVITKCLASRPPTPSGKRRGAAPKYVPAEDEKLVLDWQISCLKRVDFERERGLPPGSVTKAVDRNRRRTERLPARSSVKKFSNRPPS